MKKENRIETERLYLRPITEDDAHEIYEYAREANVGPNAGWKPLESMEETQRVMEVIFLHQESVWGIVLKETETLIGTIGLISDPKRENGCARMLGYGIGEAYWGRGYMTEAGKAVIEYGFESLGVALISAYCYPFNERSSGVLKKLGFRYEGTLSLCEVRFDGKVLDNDCYVLISK